jgi:Tol biopolymer transport system component
MNPKRPQNYVLSVCWGVVLFLVGKMWVSGADLAVQSATSPNPASSRTAAGGSYAPQFSPDSQHLVFLSTANNLVTNDNVEPFLDVFLQDLATETSTLISVNRAGLGGGNGHSAAPSLSSNGQWVVFASRADNLVAGDTNEASDIFLRDVVSEQTRLVSAPWNGLGNALGDPISDNIQLSHNPVISADGRWVVFESDATNLVALDDTNRTTDIFAHDLQTQTNRLISRNISGNSTANGASRLGGISADGRWVVFASQATDLVNDATNGLAHIYLADLEAEQITHVSREAGGWFPAARFVQPFISADGQVITFKAILPNANTVSLVAYDGASGQSSLVSSNVAEHIPVSLSADGHRIAYEGAAQVWVWDAIGQTNLLASVSLTNSGPANQASSRPTLSQDGAKVAFLSSATDLVPEDILGVSQVFLRHLDWGETELISWGESGQPNRDSIEVMPLVLSPDGARVAFESLDPRLVAEDRNLASDIFLRDWQAGTTKLVSERHELFPPTTGMGYTKLSANGLSADGQWVVFATLDNVWSAADTNRFQDLCLADLKSGTNLAIRAEKPTGDDINKFLFDPTVSVGGQVVVCVQGSGGLYGFGPTSSYDRDVYRFDLASGTRTLVSARHDGQPSADSYGPVMSADGTEVAFHSRVSASSFFPGTASPAAATTNVYLCYFNAPYHPYGGRRLVSTDLTRTATGNGASMNPQFSPNGRWLVFQSLATDLTTNLVSPGYGQLFGYHLPTRTTHLLSCRPDGTGLTNHAQAPSFSGDGHYLFYHSVPDYCGYRYDLWAGETALVTSEIVCSNGLTLSANQEGGLIAFVTPSQPGQPGQVYVRDLTNGLIRLVSVSRAGTGPANAAADSPRLSFNGRYAVFASRATDLVDHDSNNTEDVFVRDLVHDSTILVSRAWDGVDSGNQRSFDPVMSADGRTVVFRSFANNLVPGDYNLTADIFVLRLSSGDSDGDGLEDDWEVAYFGTLDRDGAGDCDGDGYTDSQEHGAGTDPTNSRSILRVLTLTRLAGGPVRLIWSAVPGRTYVVEAIHDLNGSDWVLVPGEIFATETTAAAVDQAAGLVSLRFYRVRLKN